MKFKSVFFKEVPRFFQARNFERSFLKVIDIQNVYAISITSARVVTIFSVKRRFEMKLTPPKSITFWISVALGLAGLLGHVGVLGFLAAYAFWLVFIGLVLLALALLVKGL